MVGSARAGPVPQQAPQASEPEATSDTAELAGPDDPGRARRLRWADLMKRVFRKAGWHEGRDVGDLLRSWDAELAGPGGFRMFEQAKIVLREFGGLRVQQSGPGHDFARIGFALDPTLTAGESDRFSQLEAGAGARLFPLGEAVDGNAFLAVADDGRVFLLMDELTLIGNSVEEAVNSLVEGRLPKEVENL